MPRAEIPEGVEKRALRAFLSWDGYPGRPLGDREREMRHALETVASTLHAHWLEQLKEELLSKENVERFGTGYWTAIAEKQKLQRQQRHDEAKDIAAFRVALEAWLDSIPIEEGGVA